MITLSISNPKNGVGKTATTHALGQALSSVYKRGVLLLDMDPQSKLTEACGIKDSARRSMAEVIGGIGPVYVNGRRFEIQDAIVNLSTGLYLAPSDAALAASEMGLMVRLSRENVLKNALASVNNNFDVCLIDCPANLGLLTVNALVASDAIIIPTQPTIADLRSLRLFLECIHQIQDEINTNLKVLGILITFFEARQVTHQRSLDAMRLAKLPLLPVMISKSMKIADAAQKGQSIITYAPDTPPAHSYRELAEAIEIRLRMEDERYR